MKKINHFSHNVIIDLSVRASTDELLDSETSQKRV